jgi:hypothetical protein
MTDSNHEDKFPIQVKKMTDDETREYHRNKIADLCEKSAVEELAELKEKIINGNGNDNCETKQEDKELSEHISFEDWYLKLVEKYNNLSQVVQDNLPSLWDSLEFELSIAKILNIDRCTLPFAGILLGAPSSYKTLGIQMFRERKNVFYTDSFSAKAFVSHNTGIARDKLQEIDLLPKIRNKLFLTPELSPTFTKKDDDLIEILGIMTRILDGQGYESLLCLLLYNCLYSPAIFSFILRFT